MKTKILFITSLVLITSVSFSQSKVNINNLVQYGDKMFKVDDDKPYTGKVFDLYKSNGNKKVEGYYRKGIKNGKWTYYTEIGNGKYKVKYTDGTYTVAVFTDSLGNDYTGLPITDEPEQDGIYLFQEEDKYDFSKYPTAFFTFKDGEYDGLWTKWYENGQKNGEGNFKDGKQEGLHIEWHENGQKEKEGTYKDGKEDGLWTEWWENGQKYQEGTYKDGKEDGLETSWHENGQKKGEETYKDGKRDGLSIGWYENGQKKYERTFNDGQKDGLWTSWYENGQKAGEVTFKNGELDGLLIIWYENGQKESEGTFKDGETISQECWDEDGNECECVYYGCK